MSAEASAAERSAVDGLLGSREETDQRVVLGGFHQAEARRHLLLPALHAVQDAVGWISEGALNYVCERLTVPPAEAYGVASFYALLATTPRPRRVAHVCDDIVCGPRGGQAMLAGVDERADVRPSPCLGQCDRAPAVLVQQGGAPDVVVAPAGVTDLGAEEDGLHQRDHGIPIGPSGAPQVGEAGHVLRLLRRVGVVDPTDLEAYRASGGYLALHRGLEMGPHRVIEEVSRSGLRGRGGAAYPTGAKWEAVANAPEEVRYLVANADESEPGTFKDRVLMEHDPFALVESMTIAGVAIRARHGYLYIRGEYPLATQRLRHAIDTARDVGLLGADVAGSGIGFDIEIRRGAGAYICGEETALFNSIEGYRGEPRQKPPFPTQAGLFGKPTAVNNVETLLNIPHILTQGGESYAGIGTGDSTGPKLFCLSGAIAQPGVYEVELGATIGDLLELAGGVTGELRTVLIGGAAGSFVGPDLLDLPLTFEATGEAGLGIGSGVVMPFTTEADLPAVLRRIAAFFRDESCGQCVPCRVGTVRQEEALHRIADGAVAGTELSLLGEIDQAMRDASICGLGHTAGSAVQSAIRLGLVGGSG